MAATDALTNIGAGRLLNLIRDGDAVTRADLARHTGMARSTVAQRVELLLAHRLVYEAGESASTGGRPATVLAFNEAAGVVLVADLGATHTRVAISDLAGTPLVEESHDLDITDGPESVLSWLDVRFAGLLRGLGRSTEEVRGIGLGVPGPVAFGAGRPVSPPIMPGWDGFSIPDWFAGRYDAPVLVDNDVNIMALGEHWMHWRDCEQMLYVKVGTGIGCGIISGRGAVHRGAQGAAGDIGHIQVPGHEHVLCRCGNAGCLEAVAGGRALAERLVVDPAHDVPGTRDVLRLVRAGDPAAMQAVREAGRAPRGRARGLRELLQSQRDRDRRRSRPDRAAARRCPGDRLRTLAPARHARPAAGRQPARRSRRRDRGRDHGHRTHPRARCGG